MFDHQKTWGYGIVEFPCETQPIIHPRKTVRTSTENFLRGLWRSRGFPHHIGKWSPWRTWKKVGLYDASNIKIPPWHCSLCCFLSKLESWGSTAAWWSTIKHTSKVWIERILSARRLHPWMWLSVPFNMFICLLLRVYLCVFMLVSAWLCLFK